jgi:GNAT superfamily N-acetyltransferase
MDGDTWHRYRFNIGPFDEPPFLMEPYHPRYYPRLWETAGFRPIEHYYSKAADAAAAVQTLARIHQRVLDRGYRLRPIAMNRFREEMEIIYRLSVAIFADNFLYEAISLADFLKLYEPARALIDPEFVRIAETPSGEPAGFVFSFVDYHEAVAAMRGRSGWFAKLSFLRHKRAAKAVNIKSLGVLPNYRRSGLAAALMCQSYQTALENGFRGANLCLIREGNPSGRLDGDAGTIFRRYVLYQFGEAA